MTNHQHAFLSRRTLLGGLATAGTLAAITMASNGGIPGLPAGPGRALFDSTPQSPLARAELAQWSAAIGTEFRILGSAAVRLVGVEPFPDRDDRPRGIRSRGFKAVFELPLLVSLPGELVYRLSSAAYGELDLLLAAGAGRAANRLYAHIN